MNDEVFSQVAIVDMDRFCFLDHVRQRHSAHYNSPNSNDAELVIAISGDPRGVSLKIYRRDMGYNRLTNH